MRRLRVLAVVQAALILASLGMPIGALANVGTVTVNSASQSPSPVIQGSSATFTLTAVNMDVSTTRTFNATAVSGVTGLSLSSSTCATIGPGATGSITVTLATTAATPTGSPTFTLTVADHNSPACTGGPQSTNAGTGTIVVSAKGNQTITFGALANKRPDELPLTVSATASSGLAVTFTSATPAVCTVAGTSVSYVANGLCTIRANQAGNANWNAAPQVTQSFTIAKGNQTITFGALANKRPDELPLTVSATASSGLAVTFTSATPAVCTVAGTSVSYVANGLCTIRANQAGNANWNAAPQVTQSFTIAKGNQTITFGALANKRPDELPLTVSATASSGLAVTFTSATPAVCTVAGTSVSYVANGLCTIRANQAGNANWNAAPQVTQSFTIAKGNQTITFGALANKRPDELPLTVSATASSGLAVTFTSATPAVCTVAGTSVSYVANGLCTIRANQAGNANWNAAPQVTQSFTIAKGNQTITFGALANKRPDELPLTVVGDGLLGPRRDLHLGHARGLHGGRHERQLRGQRAVHDPGEPGRQRQLECRAAGDPELHHRPGPTS